MGLWQDFHARTIDLDKFRGNYQYLEQADWYDYEGMLRYARVAWPDAKFEEDGAFGCVTKEVSGTVVSRDLLDSIVELERLRAWLGADFFKNARVLDIGAGYGRLAHRLLHHFPGCGVVCTDPIPVSRVVCAKYLKFRGADHAYVVEPEKLDTYRFDLAVNIHSWSECTLDEVEWWLALLDRVECKQLFMVPHTPNLGTWSLEKGGGNGPSFEALLHDHFWRKMKTWTGPACQERTYMLWGRE